MPRVPAYQPNQVDPSDITGSRLRPANNNGGAFGAIGEGLQQLGGAVGDMAEAQDRLNAENDDTQSRLLASNAGNAYSAATSEFTNLRAGQARAQQTAYSDKLNAIRDDALGQASNPRMKRLLEERLAGLHNAASTQMASHAVKEQRAERDAGFGAQVSMFSETAAGASDPVVRDTAIASALAVRRDQLREIDGFDPAASPEVFAAEELKVSSQIHGRVMDRLLSVPDPDIDQIGQYVLTYGDEMTAGLRADTLKRLQQPLQGRMARADADVVLGLAVAPERAQAAPAGNSAANLDAVTAHTESRGRDYDARGRPVTSPVGARFAMQVMPATARDPGFGLRPADPNNAEDMNRLGREYRAKMEERYGGDLMKMWAAYNAGPGAVDKLVERYGGNWLDHAPAETQAYVAKNMASVGDAGAQPYANSPRDWDREAIENNLNTVAQREGWTPERTDRARQELEHRIDRDEALLKDQQSEAYDQAANIVATQGDKFRTSMIPRAVWNAMTPVQQRQLQDAEEKLTAPKEAKADGAEYLSLRVMQRLDPERFKQADILSYAGKMTNSELTSMFLAQQDAIRKPAPTFAPQSAIQEAINRGTKYHGAKVDEKDLPAVYDTMAAILKARFDKNGVIGANDADEAFRTAMGSVAVSEKHWYGTTHTTRPAYEIGAGDIPTDWRTRFERNWRGGGKPTQAQVLEAWRRQMRLAQ